MGVHGKPSPPCGGSDIRVGERYSDSAHKSEGNVEPVDFFSLEPPVSSRNPVRGHGRFEMSQGLVVLDPTELEREAPRSTAQSKARSLQRPPQLDALRGLRLTLATCRRPQWALQLSPGEQRRIAFARALVQKPDWLFLDKSDFGARRGDGSPSVTGWLIGSR